MDHLSTSTLFLLLLSVNIASCNLHPDYQTNIELEESVREQRRIGQTRTQDRQPRSVSTLKVLDFSADFDGQSDDNDEYTGATLEAGPLPESFTVCSAIMVEAWTGARLVPMVQLLNNDGYVWLRSNLRPRRSQTNYEARVGGTFYDTKTEDVFFPLQWVQACLSLDSSKIKIVANGQLLVDAEYKKDEDRDRPANLTILLGFYVDEYGYAEENIGKFSNFNVFKSALSVQRMKGMTTAGGEECGAPGDLVSWEEAEWTLYSQAKVIEVDREWKGPCRRESQVQVFSNDMTFHQTCMEFCPKISNGRVPFVNTIEQWENLTREIDLITEDRSVLPMMWLSATEGDINQKLARLGHWPNTELVNNETKKLEAVETVWRDFYTGQRLGNWTKPYYREVSRDNRHGDTYNCMVAYTDVPWNKAWGEHYCARTRQSCPCSYPTQPLLRLRGRCSAFFDTLYSPKQLPGNPNSMILLGQYRSRIEYNDTTYQWILTDAKYNVSAISLAFKHSYLIGKHEWTISIDSKYSRPECKPGDTAYTTYMKLTGCTEDEFTCDDGQCIKMKRRCDQVTGEEPDCRDKSDEKGCQLLVFKDEEGYNPKIPPFESRRGDVIPAPVNISITLMKVVEIEETAHSIKLQFEIRLMWRENRVKYQNLKKKTSLNVLTEYDFRQLWLPLVIYDNTDQKDSTRLGDPNGWEWSTLVFVVREGNFTRSGLEHVDEAEIFEGSENTLRMIQTYTREFQCTYQLQKYPFDTQVPFFINFLRIF